MRPISVEFQAFGPYKNRELVDFEKLASKGLFLICGETGSGKTMILDAVTYALYGKSSGSQREDLQSARCKNAQWGVDTFVEFKFEADGKIYSFERRLECKRSNLVQKQNVYLRNAEGIYEPMFENCKDADMKKAAAQIIGMDYDQFRQVILLPQGQFEKLLTADSSEKEAVLVNIFGVDKWSKIAAKVYEQAEKHLNELKKIKEQINIRLMDENCESLSELMDNISLLESEQKELDENYKLMAYDKTKLQLESVKELLVANEAAKKEVALRAASKTNIEKQLEENNLNVIKLNEKHQQMILEKGNVENEKMLITRYEDKKSYYENHAKLSKDYQTEKDKYARFEKAAELKRGELEKKKAEQVVCGEQLKQLNEEYAMLLSAYIDSIVGNLAMDLKDGEPCPVCGSREHPNKAKLSREEVSKASVDAQKEKANKKETEFEKLNKQVLDIERELMECENEKLNQKNIIELARQVMEQAKEQFIEGIETFGDLEMLIAQKKKYVEDYEKSLEIARKDLENSKNARADIEGKLKMVAEELKKAKEKLEISKNQMDECFAVLGERYDMEYCNESLQDIELKQKQYTQNKTKYEVLIAGKKKKAEELKLMEEKYASQITGAEEDHAFAKSLRGDTGIGLQRYVLGIMFSSVIAAANKMLERVHGGRYRLYRTDEKVKGSNKKGLELFVYDSFSGDTEGRSVKTLSGGEKFLVSLALSIGLSTVAKRSGIHLDAMFIDEGFGSLDQNSIEDAMDILMGIQKANGVVGIISHVQLLKDNIPTKLEIVKSKEGSKIIKN